MTCATIPEVDGSERFAHVLLQEVVCVSLKERCVSVCTQGRWRLALMCRRNPGYGYVSVDAGE